VAFGGQVDVGKTHAKVGPGTFETRHEPAPLPGGRRTGRVACNVASARIGSKLGAGAFSPASLLAPASESTSTGPGTRGN